MKVFFSAHSAAFGVLCDQRLLSTRPLWNAVEYTEESQSLL